LFREFPFDRVLGGLADIHGVSVRFRATDEEKAANDADARALADKASFLEVGRRHPKSPRTSAKRRRSNYQAGRRHERRRKRDRPGAPDRPQGAADAQAAAGG
jgi:hypothetical protein